MDFISKHLFTMHNAYMEPKDRKMSLYFPVFITSAWTFHPEISFCSAVDGSLLTGEFLGDTAPDNPAYPRGP